MKSELVAITRQGAAAYKTAAHGAQVHLFGMDSDPMLLSVDGGSIYEIDPAFARAADASISLGDERRALQLIAAAGIKVPLLIPELPPESVPVRAFSLAVAQKCNLGCTYCYAGQGSFGEAAKNMPLDVAKMSVDRLLDGVGSGEKVSLAFLGGEPFINRHVLVAVTEYAASRADDLGVDIGFSLTTNGTLLDPDDALFFDKYRFSVTLSIDGTKKNHDLLRPFKSGKGSYDRVVGNARLLLDRPGRRSRLTARVTVTPENLDLPESLAELAGLGFDSVMFSPVLSAPSGRGHLGQDEFPDLLAGMVECGKMFERALSNGRIYPFKNIITTLQRIHAYSRDAYPCGAGGGYMGVSADGGLFACHRFVGDERGRMGTVIDGVDRAKQAAWLGERNVHMQEPCRTCWARYLCSGGCHHETINAGRPACDYIRGWLHYCLEVYARLLKNSPKKLREALALG